MKSPPSLQASYDRSTMSTGGSEGAGIGGGTYKWQCRHCKKEIPGIAAPDLHFPQCPFCEACGTCGEPSRSCKCACADDMTEAGPLCRTCSEPSCKCMCTDTNVHTDSSEIRSGGEDPNASTKEITDEAAIESNPPLVPHIPKKTQIISETPTKHACEESRSIALCPAQDLTRKSMSEVKRAVNDGKEEDQLVTEKDSVRTEVQHQKDEVTDASNVSNSKEKTSNEQEQGNGASNSEGVVYYDTPAPKLYKGDNEGVSEYAKLGL